jgi:hypothetical protein
MIVQILNKQKRLSNEIIIRKEIITKSFTI